MILIMGCDQTLECNKKIISKPENLCKQKKIFVFKWKETQITYMFICIKRRQKNIFIEEVKGTIFQKKFQKFRLINI